MFVMLCVNEPREKSHPAVRGTQDTTSSSSQTFPVHERYTFPPSNTGIPSAFSYKIFLPRQVMELLSCGQNLKNLNPELSKKIFKKDILPTRRGNFLYRCTFVREKNLTCSKFRKSRGKNCLPSGPSNPTLSQSHLLWDEDEGVAVGQEEKKKKSRKAILPLLTCFPTSPLSALSWQLFPLPTHFLHSFPRVNFTLEWAIILKKKPNKKNPFFP